MKREKWYVIGKVTSGGVTASTDIHGIRLEGTQLYPASIVPGDWFKDIGRVSETLIFKSPAEGGKGVAIPYQPESDEYTILYTVYPATVPKRDFTAINDGKSPHQRWYKVGNTRFVPIGLQSLISVDGICQFGDVAQRGQIVPHQWFSALTADQIRRLCDTGITSTKTRNGYGDNARRINTMPLLETYKPDPYELGTLQEKYPGTSPDYAIPIIEEEKIKE